MNGRTYGVIGAGVAGLATALFLLKTGRKNVEVFEKEPFPGRWASGNNAGMLHHYHPDEELRSMLSDGIRLLKAFNNRISDSFLTSCPSLWLLPDERAKMVIRSGETSCRQLPAGDVPEAFRPEGENDGFRYLQFPEDGLVDAGAFLQTLTDELKQRGGALRTNIEITSGRRLGDRWILRSASDTYPVTAVINAAGAWAGEVGDHHGSGKGGLQPEGRYLFQTTIPFPDLDYSYYWDRKHNIYFRRLSEGTLVSVCENVTTDPGEAPGHYENIRQLLAERITSTYPQFSSFSIQNSWWCQRSFFPDRLPFIGADPDLDRFYWVSGLGGHGVSASMATGRKAVNTIAHFENHSR